MDNVEDNSETPLLGKTKTSATSSPFLRQSLVALGPIILAIASGITLGYSAILLPQLQDKDSIITIDTNQASWIAAISTIPMIIGCLLSSVFTENVGRKMTILFTTIPCIIGWIIIGTATSIAPILVGRFFTGLCLGLAGPSSSVYIGETSEHKYRGLLLTAFGISIALGLFISHLLGTFLAWKTVAFVTVSLPIACIILLTLMPESPAWLANKRRIRKAEQAFYWCRGYTKETVEEFSIMVQKQTANTPNRISWNSIKRPEFWKPLLILNVAFLTSQFSGVNAVAFYSVSLMKDAVGKNMNEYMAMMIIDTTRLISSVLACVLSRRFGRRPLINISTLGTSLSLLSLSLFLYMSKTNPDIAKISVIPLIALIGFMLFITIGLVPLPWSMIGEVFPHDMRGIGSGVCTSINFIAAFIVVKTNPAMIDYMQNYSVFLCYGCAALIGFCILFFKLPETKGKTLEQVQEQLSRSR